MVLESDAGVHPGAVVVEPGHTPVAGGTVLGAEGAPHLGKEEKSVEKGEGKEGEKELCQGKVRKSERRSVEREGGRKSMEGRNRLLC